MTSDEIARLVIQIQERGLDQVTRKMAALDVQGARTAKATEQVESRFSRLDNTVGDFNRTMTGAGNVVKLVKFPALIAGAGMAAQAVGALGAGAVGLGAALGPLAGAGAGAAAGYAAMGQAAGVAKLATMGLSEALGGNKDALKALPPAGRDFVEVVKSLKPELKALQQTAAAGMLPGVAAGARAALPALKPLKPLIGDTAAVLGDLARNAGRLVGSDSVLRDLSTIGATNIGVIRNLGNAALTLGHALIGVVAAGGPLLKWFSELGLQAAKFIDAQVTAGRESGRLAAFLERTRDVMSTLGKITGNLVVGLFNIARAATPLGTDLLERFEKLTAKFREWTESASGQNQIAAYFRNAKAPLLAIFGLIGDIGGAFLRISQGKGATGLIEQMRTLVPILEDVIVNTTAAFGPALIDALGNLGRLFGALAGSNGPLVMMVRLIGLIAGGLADLLENNPMLNSMVVSFTGLYGVMKATAFVFGPLIAASKALQVAFIGQAAATSTSGVALIGQRLSLIATGVAMYASAAATAVMTGATWALNTAIAVLTSPITLTIAAIAALVAGIILAYKHSETFRNVVNGMWAVLKTVAAWLATAGVDAFNAVADAVKFAWGIVKTVTEAVWGGIVTYLKNAWADIKGAWDDFWGVFYPAVSAAWRAVRDVISSIWAFIKDKILVPVWNAIKVAADAAWALIRLAILGPIRSARDGLVQVWAFIKDSVLAPAWSAIKTAADLAWEAIKGAILSPIRAARDALGGKDGIWEKIKAVASTAWDGIRGAIKAAADPILDVITAPFKAGLKAVAKFAKLILEVIDKIPGVNTEPMQSAVDGVVKGLAKGGVHGLARGGAYARTGGLVSAPITLMGEEAPRHPEFVIPTNPAYRKRAMGLLGQAAGAIGFAEGGVLGGFRSAVKEAKPPPKAHLALWMAGIVESGLRNLPYGDRDSRGALQIRDSTARGMGINNMDPYASALAFLTRGFWGKGSAISLAGRYPAASAGWVAQNTQGSAYPARYDEVHSQVLNYLKGYSGPVGGEGLSLNPADFIGKLPGVGDLPGWLKGTGEWVIDKAKDYIKRTVSGLFSSDDAGSIKGTVEKAIAFAATLGFPRPVGNQLTGGTHNAGSLHYAGRAADFGDAGRTPKQMQSLFYGLYAQFGKSINELFYDRMPWYIDGHSKRIGQFGGHDDHIHVGFAKGGLYGAQNAPFVGAYRNGGTVPADGFGYLHKGETVTPAGAGGPLVHVEHMEVTSEMDLERFARQVGWQIMSAA